MSSCDASAARICPTTAAVSPPVPTRTSGFKTCPSARNLRRKGLEGMRELFFELIESDMSVVLSLGLLGARGRGLRSRRGCGAAGAPGLDLGCERRLDGDESVV